MEKGKVHVKNEHRGVPVQSQSQNQQLQKTPTKTSEGHVNEPLSPESKSSYMGSHQNLDHNNLQQIFYHTQPHASKKTTNSTNIPQTECDSLGNSANDGVFPLCYVCGGNGGCESLRVRPNQECPTEPYFSFLERHEPPNGVPKVNANQTYVIACMLCYRSLREQWDAYERKKKPHLQRLYHMKRVDGKNYIGADIQTQGEYAAQLLGLSADHLQHGNLHDEFAYLSGGGGGAPNRTPNRVEYERSSNVNQYYPQPAVQSRNESPSPHYAQMNNTNNITANSVNAQQQYCDYYSRSNVNAANLNGKMTPQQQTKEKQQQLPKGNVQLNEDSPSASVETRRTIGGGVSGSSPYDTFNIKSSSSFAHHKFKLGQISYMNSPAARNSENNTPNDAQKMSINSTLDNKFQQQQQRQDRISPFDYGMTGGVGGGSHSNAPSMADADDTGAALDLRNSSSNMCEPYMLSCGTSRQMFRNTSPSGAQAKQVDVGILDLSMPDKNSMTEVCYVCGDEQRRGSLIELSTVRPKDFKGRHHPYFPIFNEQHPRPPRSRPKDPRGMIQACQLCYENLIQQWNNYQTTQTPENDRSYTLRKKPASVTERTTFVCYTCGGDTPSSRLRLVYCCPNAEREPYYPFIKTMKAFKNASPISPQGMVQICSSCYEKHLYLAEGGNNATMTAATSSGRISGVGGAGDSNAGGIVTGTGAIYSIDSDTNMTNNNVIVTSGADGVAGRYTPSEKSLANSDSTSNVKFKRDFKFARQGDSRPNSPTSSSQGPGDSERGQYPCYICKVLCGSNKMEWLSTSAEHMNSHAMHFPCLRSSNGRDNASLSGNMGGGNSNSGGNNADTNNRVLACKDCVNYLARQWETMDAERVPLEHRRYSIPSPMITSSSPNGSRHGGLTITTPPSTPSVSSTPASTSIYCFLCGLHSDLTLARVLYASKEGSRPYFPHLLKHNSLPNAEQLRKDYSALVCTFCYHSMLNQWRKYEAQTPAIAPTERKYNWHDYICHLCGITTYRKRVRALPVNEFPFVKNRKNGDGLLLENGEYAVVCLDCYESLRQQASHHDRFGVPISRRGYNWVPQPPPPEDSPDAAVARLPCGERSDRFPANTTLRSISTKKIASPKQCEKAKDVPQKSGQKRPASSPAPPIPSPHHIQSPSATPGACNNGGSSSSVQMTSNPTLMNHHMTPGQLSGLQAAQLQQQQQQHQAHQQAVAAAAAAAQAQQQMVGVPNALNTAQSSGRGPFASALRNLAKQADIKEEDDINVRSERTERTGQLGSGGGGGVPGGNSAGGGSGVPTSVSVANTSINASNSTRSSMANDRLPPTGGGGPISSVDERLMAKKRAASSPIPAEKIARMSSQQSVQMQPELLARSGFQPYRSDERLIHPAGAFPLDAYATFAALPTMPPGPFLSPPGLPYSDQLYLDQRFQMLRAAGSHHTHPHALYSPMASPYASHLYSMIPGAALGLGSALHERMKLEEEHRARIAREEEREREMQREKEQREREREQREREQREKEQRERELREKEQREKEQKEKEARERELREKERETRERERQILSASHHYTSQLYPLGRNLLGPMMPHLGLGLRAPPGGLHSLPPMSAYHAAASQRQSPHAAMGLNLGLPGLGSVHGPGSLPHQLQPGALGLPHPGAAGLTHPGFPSAAALGLSHHGLNLTHPHISPHHPAMVPTHQISPHSHPSSLTPTSTTNKSPHNLNLSMQNNASGGVGMKVSTSNSVAGQSSVSGLQSSVGSMTQPTSTLSSHIPQMSNALYHTHHSSQQLSNAGLAPTSAHQQPPTSMPLSLTSNSGRSHSASPITMKATPQSSNNNSVGLHNQNGGRAASSPHPSRQLGSISVVQHHQQQSTAMHDKPNTLTLSSNLEPATLDLTGSNSNSSVQVSSVASSGGGHNTHTNEINGSGTDQTSAAVLDRERKDIAAVGATKKVSLNVSTTDKRSPSISPPVAAKENTTVYNIIVEESTRQCSPNSANAEPHTSSITPPAKPSIGSGEQQSSLVGGTTVATGTGNNYSKNPKVIAVPPDNIVKSTTIDPNTKHFTPNSQSMLVTHDIAAAAVVISGEKDAQPSQSTLTANAAANTTNNALPSTTTPDATASLSGGVTSTTSGSTSPPVVSSSTNIVNHESQKSGNCLDDTVSSATPSTTTSAAEVDDSAGGR
ncbi:uncharacterized protein px isoform X2 [Eurosta solidaginis]|uniref:uncharacterized protein px isoform X2 n=1 Tax=Eurosta solidaginis TaxID=178769 RepID=UPI003531174E